MIPISHTLCTDYTIISQECQATETHKNVQNIGWDIPQFLFSMVSFSYIWISSVPLGFKWRGGFSPLSLGENKRIKAGKGDIDGCWAFLFLFLFASHILMMEASLSLSPPPSWGGRWIMEMDWGVSTHFHSPFHLLQASSPSLHH